MTDRPVALVTGAARGIGAAVARRLASDGWQLALFDRCADDPGLDYPLATPADLEQVAEQCAAAGSEVVAVVGDVREQGSLDAAVARAVIELGGLDAAIAVAGVIAGGAPAWESGDAELAAMIDVNLAGVWHLVTAAVPALLKRPVPRRGRVIAVASAGAVVGLPKLSAYSASKHAVVGLIRSVAAELGGEQITANVVAPGSTRTEMLNASAAIYELDGVEEFAAHHLDPRLLAPEEVAHAVAWLASAGSSGVTGAVIPVDAGMTAH